MKSGSNYLNYQLFSDSSRNTQWNNTAGTGVPQTMDGTARLYCLRHNSPAQNSPAGTYTDTLIITVTY